MAEKKAHKHPEETNIAAVGSPELPNEPMDEAVPPPAEPQPTEDSQEVKDLKEANGALVDRNLRLMAEYDNYRKRTQRERENIYPDAIAATLINFLPILDNFQRALEMPCADEAYAKGIEMIYTNLLETMTHLGMEEVAQPGDPFDPNLHNAVMHVDDETLKKNVVAVVLQKGYKIGDRILRHAMVQVAN